VRIRSFEKREGVCIFDLEIDAQFSTYEALHLNELASVEKDHFWFKSRRDYICKEFRRHVKKGARILEIGSGTGFVAEKLQELGFSIEVSDIHSNGLREAKKRGLQTLYQFDLFNPPFVEEFDVVCLFDVFEHLKDQERALLCLSQMLKKGGLIILTVPSHQWLWSRDDVIAGHEMRFNKKNLKQLFASSNLQTLSVRYFFASLVPFLLLRKWLRKDKGTPLRKEEELNIRFNPVTNRFFTLLTQLELYLHRLIPNAWGGSLLGIARKIE
jgi:2-polyprenyl-3-methyl-5-hydroxy-6-metoxy-1,4-benzoquinol methylase